MNRTLPALALAAALLGCAPSAWARGPSPYLPLNLDPEIERQVERVMILADRPVMSRPIAAAVVLEALPAACRIDAVLCRRVRDYLERYTGRVGVPHGSAEVAAADDNRVALPNRHGMSSDSPWSASATVYWQPWDYAIVSLGAVAYEGDTTPTGSMLSVGFEYAQLDVGYRDHWLSPFTDSAMLISTEAQTLPSITLSNYKPISPLGLQYEVFLAQMEFSDRIAFEDRFTSGHPRLSGLRLTIEPAHGWSLAAGRLMQFGGGERGGDSFGDFLDALFNPGQHDNRSDTLGQDEEFGNQVAAWSSRFIYPGRIPFSVYLEYAGEDTSFIGSSGRLGNAALSIGVDIPRLWDRFDLTYEASEWQNGWYVHSIYRDGLTQARHVLGHWGADERQFGDGVGAQAHMLRIGWEPGFGGRAQLRARTVANESYSPVEYERAYELSLSYSRGLRGYTAGAEVLAGRDVFGERYGRIAGFVRLGAEWAHGDLGPWSRTARDTGAEMFIDAGVNAARVHAILGDDSPGYRTPTAASPHIGVGVRRRVSERSDLGVRLEVDTFESEMLLAVRAFDYRYRFASPWALTAFAGAARYDLATPAYGYYLGVGVQRRDILPRTDLSFDLRYADKMARDKLLPQDPPSTPRPDSFYDVSAATLSLSFRF